MPTVRKASSLLTCSRIRDKQKTPVFFTLGTWKTTHDQKKRQNEITRKSSVKRISEEKETKIRTVRTSACYVLQWHRHSEALG